jgi:glycosyltransferase involved in cell wall biosynthesis
MASGLAVAGFDYAAAKLYLRDGDNGLVVPGDRPDLLVSAGVRLATEAALRARLRAAAPGSLARQSWDRVVAGFETDLLAVIAAHPP